MRRILRKWETGSRQRTWARYRRKHKERYCEKVMRFEVEHSPPQHPNLMTADIGNCIMYVFMLMSGRVAEGKGVWVPNDFPGKHS